MFIFEEIFAGSSYLTQALYLLQLAFTIWMLVNAYQRGAEWFWYWVIFFFQPLGAWIYFFVVKLRTMRWPARGMARTGPRSLSLDQLRYAVGRAPTVANRIALAERLMEKGQHAEAIPLVEAVLAIEPDYCVALHALAECRLATESPEQAVAPLEKLLQRDPRWSNYRAWRTLLEAHRARGKPADGLAACREFVKRLPTLEIKCLLAEHLIDNEQASEAVQLLDDALEEQQLAPWSSRWQNRRWARQAHRLIAEAEKVEKSKVAT